MSAAMDVYAPPYVPLAFRKVNDAPAHVVPCLPAPWINYDAYVRTFAGTAFLASQTQPRRIPGADPQPSTADTQSLDQDTYLPYFRETLSKETLAREQEVRNQAVFQTSLVPTGENSLYRLHVPGLRETSLPIEVGDILKLKQLNFGYDGLPIAFSGYITQAGEPVPSAYDLRFDTVIWGIDRLHENLLLRIDGLSPTTMLFNACFTVQSGRLDALDRAVHSAHRQLSEGPAWLRTLLFPSTNDGMLQTTLGTMRPRIDLFDSTLNHAQRRAIETIVKDDFGQVPFLITGPPGTGKTKTVVELAMQLLAQEPSAHLIVCAPSDSAADTLALRLSKYLTPQDLFRLISPARSFPEVPNTILPWCHVEDQFFSLPSFSEMMSKRIVVVTARDAEILHHARLINADLHALECQLHLALHPETEIAPRLHWSALIMDEAAQATEPESLLPLLVVAPPQGKFGSRTPLVVMVGDQNQLGPRTASKHIALQRSLFERLLARPLYHDHPMARSKERAGQILPLTSDMLPIIRAPFGDLIQNYRSHPGILAISSSLFYNDTLEPAATDTDSLLIWDGFAGRQLPLLFDDNRSPDEIEQDGGGWYNLEEATKALSYAESFINQGLILPHDICIMSPFRAQVKVLRTKARSAGMHGINIGPLEAFQGLESRLVILCTTRTRNRFIDQDVARGLGVIYEPKRFNVALTRAKQGLIVIGNADVLDQDENWVAFLAFCKRNHAWKGESAWMPPHSSRIRRSRLEKRWEIQKSVRDAEQTSGKLGLGSNSTIDDVMWTKGIAAEDAVLRVEELSTEAHMEK